MVDKESKTFTDYLKKVSPGSSLRIVIDDLISANMGALVVFYSPEIEKIMEGGFKINCKFTANRLFELCKMDGAIIVSSDIKKILFANVLLVPDIKIMTTETGTRHKAAERTAKQANTFVIAVSERKNKTTLYLSNIKHHLKNTKDLLGEVTSNLNLLDAQREVFNELVGNLDVLEMSNLVTVADVCKTIQKAEMILKISEMIKRYFTELGNVGTIMNLKYRELTKGVEKIFDNILRDYSNLSLKKSRALLSTFHFETLMDLEIIAKLMFGKTLEEAVGTRGYRFLSNTNLNDKEISLIVQKIGRLENLFDANPEEIQEILKSRDAEGFRNEMKYLREQILSRKEI